MAVVLCVFNEHYWKMLLINISGKLKDVDTECICKLFDSKHFVKIGKRSWSWLNVEKVNSDLKHKTVFASLTFS